MKNCRKAGQSMSEYKLGDEVLLRCKVREILPHNTIKVEIKSDHANYYSIFVEESYIGGKSEAEEAWELAKKIACSEYHGGISAKALDEIFGPGWTVTSILTENTREEITAKVAAYEKKREKEVVIPVSKLQEMWKGIMNNIWAAAELCYEHNTIDNEEEKDNG